MSEKRYLVEMDCDLAKVLKNSGQIKIIEFYQSDDDNGGGSDPKLKIFNITWSDEGESEPGQLPTELVIDPLEADIDALTDDMWGACGDWLWQEYGYPPSTFDIEWVNT